MGHEEHREKAAASVSCAILTVSDTRSTATDASGRLIRELLEAAGHSVAGYRVVPDDPDMIRAELSHLAQQSGCQAILVNGGTGISARDRTYEAIVGLLEKRLDGFGELFRVLSFEQIGAAAMLSRAVAGVYAGRAVFSMPGSPGAVRLAMERLILPELGHIVYELHR